MVINFILCKHDIYAIMRIKLKSHNIHVYNSHNVYLWHTHVEPCINKLHKLPFFVKTHKFLSRINNRLYGSYLRSTREVVLRDVGAEGTVWQVLGGQVTRSDCRVNTHTQLSPLNPTYYSTWVIYIRKYYNYATFTIHSEKILDKYTQKINGYKQFSCK